MRNLRPCFWPKAGREFERVLLGSFNASEAPHDVRTLGQVPQPALGVSRSACCARLWCRTGRQKGRTWLGDIVPTAGAWREGFPKPVASPTSLEVLPSKRSKSRLFRREPLFTPSWHAWNVRWVRTATVQCLTTASKTGVSCPAVISLREWRIWGQRHHTRVSAPPCRLVLGTRSQRETVYRNGLALVFPVSRAASRRCLACVPPMSGN